MKKLIITVIVITPIITSFLPLATGDEETYSIEELVKLAPCLTVGQENITSFEVSGLIMINNVYLKFAAAYAKPDRFMLRLYDTGDGTPILEASDNKFLFYDPISSAVYTGSTLPAFVMKMESENKKLEAMGKSEADDDAALFIMSFGLMVREDEGELKTHDTFTVDIRSIMDTLVKGLEVKEEDDGVYIVTGFSKSGGKARAYIQPSRKECPYLRIELYTLDSVDEEPDLVIHRIAVNVPIPPEKYTFPDMDLSKTDLPLVHITSKKDLKTLLNFNTIVRALMARLALRIDAGEELMPFIEKMCAKKPDWKRIRQEDEKISIILKTIFAEQSTQVDDSVK